MTIGWWTIGSGSLGSVSLFGPPSELLLYLCGRREGALVEVQGDTAAVARLTAIQLSL